MKKVGIITFNRSYNHGAVLQAFSLKEAIKELGYSVSVIDYTVKNDFNMYSPALFSQGLLYFPIKLFLHSWNVKRAKAFESFRQSFLNLSPEKFSDDDDLSSLNEEYDIFVAGSDQIWNIKFVGIKKDFFLSFVSSNKNKIAYAPSIGDSNAEFQKNSLLLHKLLESFNAISSRETKGASVLSKITNKDVPVVLDPTMLIDPVIFKEMATQIKPDHFLFAYFVGNADIRCVKTIAKKKKLKIKYQAAQFIPNADNILRFGPLEFIGFIKSADYVVTSSYHGVIFSILFQKQFCVCKLSSTDDRVISLLERLNLTSRIFHEGFDIDEPINYNEVHKIISKERIKSLRFLADALENYSAT